MTVPRARNIKHSFFQNVELGEIEPLARLLFIGMWTVADFKGCLEFKPKKLKIQLLPYDDCDIEKLANDLDKSGLISIYSVQGQTYIKILNFVKHQNPHKNEKDAGSDIPDFEEKYKINNNIKIIEINREQDGTTRADSCFLNPENLNLNLKENLIKENSGAFELESPKDNASLPAPLQEKRKSSLKGTRIPEDWVLRHDQVTWALNARPDLKEPDVYLLGEGFKDFWLSKSGNDAVKVDWNATWRNWVRNDSKFNAKKNGYGQPKFDAAQQAIENLKRFRDANPNGFDFGDGNDPL